MTQFVTLLLDSKLVSVLCHFGNFGCGDGGWTPVMKMDGNKVRHLCTFSLSLATRVEKNVLLIIKYRFASVSGNFQLFKPANTAVSPCSSIVARDVSSGGTFAPQRQKFHTNDVNL